MKLLQGLAVALSGLLFACAAPAGRTADDAARLTPEELAALEWVEVARVVDGDTLHVRRGGRIEKLRLLSVDTEEKLTGRAPLSPSKPETLFGEECAQWARRFFAELADEGQAPRVGLRFPDGREQRDVYGRLLCHVVLPDGRDFDLLLVQLGKSPYFNKYGNSRICHGAFVEAQAAARRARLGIWNPATNRPKDPGAPAARRPYDRLLPWWDLRARAIDEYRAAKAAAPDAVLAADDPAELGRLAALAGSPELRVFCEVDRFFDEADGSRTVLLRGDREHALRAVLPAGHDGRIDALLEASRREFAPNHLWLRGRLEPGPRGPVIVAGDPDQWSLAAGDQTRPTGGTTSQPSSSTSGVR